MENYNLFAVFLLDIIFDLEDEGSTVLRNVGKPLPDYTASHSRTQFTYSSNYSVTTTNSLY
jgi:hypothetical protein